MSAKDWVPQIDAKVRPRYVAIAEAIGADIQSGRLVPGDRLPPQRRIAASLDLDVSAIARAYAEAARRGYVEAHVGRGTFVRDQTSGKPTPDPRRTLEEDPRMNMPPEPDDPELIASMQAGFAEVAANIVPLMRYQTAIGSSKDREIAAKWMHSNGVCDSLVSTICITPGAHAAIHGALSVLRRTGTVVLCEQITYPGIRAITSRLELPLVGLEEDEHGITPDALAAALRIHEHAILYLNPTLRNPTTQTIPEHRRREIAAVLDKNGAPLIEDDAYCFVTNDALSPISTLVPELGWHIAGVSKVFGAGLRLAFVQVPNNAWLNEFLQAIRATSVMTSPLSLALLSTWIEDGTATRLQAFVRSAAAERYAIACEALKEFSFLGHRDAFNIWLSLPDSVSRAEVLARLRARPIGVLPSDVFTPSSDPPEALRVCLGGPITPQKLEFELQNLSQILLQRDWSG